jgi:hypothetical protein
MSYRMTTYHLEMIDATPENIGERRLSLEVELSPLIDEVDPAINILDDLDATLCQVLPRHRRQRSGYP